MAPNELMAPATDQPCEDPANRSGFTPGRRRRLLAIVLILLVMMPASWWRSRPRWERANDAPTLWLEPVAAKTPRSWPSGLRLMGAWYLVSSNNRFGGYSALLATKGGTLAAVSDMGRWMRFSAPGSNSAATPQFGTIYAPDSDGRYAPGYYSDIEAATQDQGTGSFWLSYEKTNLIRRFAYGGGTVIAVAPRAMRGWWENGGAESMTRLPDGRFIVLAEDPSWLSAGGRAGLLFPSDPITGAEPLEFSFRPPIGYSPSDMAVLPDGRAVILLRALDLPFPPFFKGMLVVADPRDIVAGKDWPWRKLADIADPVPRDNYEGLAIAPDATGVTMWLISDDNFMPFQRTLLLKLHWDLSPRMAADAD